jgi:hypothetical protein
MIKCNTVGPFLGCPVATNPKSFCPGLDKYPPLHLYSGEQGDGSRYTWPLALPTAFLSRGLVLGSSSALLVLSNPQNASNYCVVVTLSAILLFFDGYTGTPWTERADAYWMGEAGTEKLGIKRYRVLAGIGFFGGSTCELLCLTRCHRLSTPTTLYRAVNPNPNPRYIQSPCAILCVACMTCLAPRAKLQQRMICGSAVAAYTVLSMESGSALSELGLLVALACCVGLESHAISVLRGKLGTTPYLTLLLQTRVETGPETHLVYYVISM